MTTSLIRQIKHTFGSSLTIILLLATGIGGSTAIFAVMRPVLLKPLPYERPDQIMAVWENRPEVKRLQISSMDAEDLAQRGHVFQETAAYRVWLTNVSGRLPAEQLPVAKVSRDFFKLLGIAPMMGRQFGAADFAGLQPVAIISAQVWREQFNNDAGILTQTVKINGDAHAIVGVMPDSFEFPFYPSSAQVWIPLVLSSAEQHSRTAHNLLMIARLRDGVSLRQAQEEASSVAKQLSLEHPDTNSKIGVALVSVQSDSSNAYSEGLLTLLGASGLILFIACANTSSLLLLRGLARQRTVAIQRVLGATNARIVRSQLTECALLALAGAILGLGVAKLCLQGASVFIQAMPRSSEVRIDAPVVGFSIAVSLLCALLSGIAPVIQLRSRDFRGAALERGGETMTGQTRRLQRFLIIGETALAFVLLVGAGLLVRTVTKLRSVPVGFNPQNVLTMNFVLPQKRYPGPSSYNQFARSILTNLEQLPSVKNVAIASPLPWQGAISESFNKQSDPAHKFQVNLINCTPDFFKVLEIPLLRGRLFTEHDDSASPHVAIINEAMARRNWPGGNPLGEIIDVEDAGVVTVVGVVGDFHQLGFKTAPTPSLFVPFSQMPYGHAGILVRTAVAPMNLTVSIRARIAAVDPEVPPSSLRTLSETLFRSIQEQVFITVLLALFSGLSLILAIIGLYGFIAQTVALRQREFAVRLALGASRRNVLSIVIKNGLLLTSIGIAAGLLAALLASQTIKSLLWQVTSKDPATFIAITILLYGVNFVAICWPAYRATRIAPSQALREQ
jgi:putative ABC transport system permease protein